MANGTPDTSNIPPEIMALLDPMMKGGESMLLQEILTEELRRGRDMQDTKMPDMHRYGDNHVVAANPMEIAAAAIKQYRGGEQARDALAGRKEAVGKEAAAYRALMLSKLLREYPAAAQAQAAPPAVAPVPGLGQPGQEGPDITEGRSVPPRKPRVPGALAPPAPTVPGAGPVDMDPALSSLIYGR